MSDNKDIQNNNKPSFSKKDNVFSGGVYKTKKELIGRLEPLRTMKLKGQLMKKEEWSGFFTDMVKARKGKISFEQMERDMRLKHKIPQRERNRIMDWAKKEFSQKNSVPSQNSPKKNKGGLLASLKIFSKQKFVSPKDAVYQRDLKDSYEQSGSLGLSSAKQGFKIGHHATPGSMSGGGGVKNNKPEIRGLTQTGSTGLTRQKPGVFGVNNSNMGRRPRIGGLWVWVIFQYFDKQGKDHIFPFLLVFICMALEFIVFIGILYLLKI